MPSEENEVLEPTGLVLRIVPHLSFDSPVRHDDARHGEILSSLRY